MRRIRYADDFIDPFQDRVSPVIKDIFQSWWGDNVNVYSISGPRNCSKSNISLFLIMTCCELFPGCQVGIVRHEYATIKNTIVPGIDDFFILWDWGQAE